MTEERLRALHGLVAAVQEWARSLDPGGPQLQAERRLAEALAAVETCGADVAVVVELTGEGVRRLDAKPPA